MNEGLAQCKGCGELIEEYKRFCDSCKEQIEKWWANKPDMDKEELLEYLWEEYA